MPGFDGSLTSGEHRRRRQRCPGARRTGEAGGADLSVISQKMANTVASSAHLQKTYLPVNETAVELADEARKGPLADQGDQGGGKS